MATVREHKIVISKNATYNERRAAIFLSNTIKKLGGGRPVMIFDDTEPTENEIVIGRTAREAQCGVSFERGIISAEYELRFVDSRLYITGLGVLPEQNPDSVSTTDFGDIGTIFAVYYFMDKILKHEFQYYTKLNVYEGDLDAVIDESCNFVYSLAARSADKLPDIDGTAMHFYCCVSPTGGGQCVIFKTKSGKLVVMDGGLNINTETVLRWLEELWDGEGKPVVSAWMLTHMHADHFQVYTRICTTPEYISRLKVENFYADLLDDDFYIRKTSEPSQYHVDMRHIMVTEHEELGVKYHNLKTGEHIVVDELDFEVIHTPSDVVDNPRKVNPNDSSVIYKLTVDGGQTILFLGDGEGVVSDQLLDFHRDKLKSDVVQVGHHGVANVSGDCYNEIKADVYLYSCLHKTWFLEWGNEIFGSHDPGMKRQHHYMNRLGAKSENVYHTCFGGHSFKLPMEIK